MSYTERRFLAGAIIFGVALFVFLALVLGPGLYQVLVGMRESHVTGVAMVAGGLVEFFITVAVLSLPAAGLAYWLSGVFVKRPLAR